MTSISSVVQTALETSLEHILTPQHQIDLLHNIQQRKELLKNNVPGGKNNARPYVIVFCGVNGVGKSTNLAKIAFYLKQNDINVMIAACDTFRSGALEQLDVHCRNLNLFKKGYNKPPEKVCHAAIEYASRSGFDCVLVDTAGRMQENVALMESLTRLVYLNTPDTVLFVGEALVGNDGVDQLVTFDRKLKEGAAWFYRQHGSLLSSLSASSSGGGCGDGGGSSSSSSASGEGAGGAEKKEGRTIDGVFKVKHCAHQV